MGCAELKPLDIDVWTGNTPDQIKAAHDLWQEWSQEEHGRPLDVQAWIEATASLLKAQRLMYFVAYHDRKAVGMVQALWQYDVLAQEWVGFGDHAYVSPEYRNEGTFTALYDAIYGFTKMMDFDQIALPVGTSGVGKFLQPFYEKRGFVDKAHFMRQRAPWRTE